VTHDPRLRAQLQRHEGLRRRPYRCTAGHWTIGIGWNIDAHPLPPDIAARVAVGEALTDAEVDRLYTVSVQRICEELPRAWRPFTDLDDVRQRALVDMAFMGVPRVLGFRRMLHELATAITAVSGEDAITHYERAALEALNSKWARVDVQPARSRWVAHQLRTGQDPTEE
jgi:lysozyme